MGFISCFFFPSSTSFQQQSKPQCSASHLLYIPLPPRAGTCSVLFYSKRHLQNDCTTLVQTPATHPLQDLSAPNKRASPKALQGLAAAGSKSTQQTGRGSAWCHRSSGSITLPFTAARKGAGTATAAAARQWGGWKGVCDSCVQFQLSASILLTGQLSSSISRGEVNSDGTEQTER